MRNRHPRLSVEALEPRDVPAIVTTALDTDDADRPNGDFIGADGQLSFREAIEMVNSKGGSITFSGPATISLNDPLPELTRPTTIIGATVSGGKPGIVIEGGFFNGMVFRAGGTVKNLVIQGFGTSGLIFNGVGRVENCFIGTDATGTTAVPNGQTGVVLNKGGTVLKSVISGNTGAGILVAGATALIENNFIGTNFTGSADLGNGTQGVILRGSLAVVRNNVISGNDSEGVWIDGLAAKSNRLVGNKIGVAVDGTTPLANTLGVFVSNKATLNTVGGTTIASRNIIAGNTDDGIRLELAGISNRIQGNFIGVDATGTTAEPNGGDGVEILESLSNVVGGSAVGTRNIIAGNTGVGVRIIGLAGIPASKNVVSGNFIGLNANGADLGHSIGVMLERFATNNTIGGTTSLARNIISGNDQAGIWISDLGTSGNKVQGNYIGTDATGKLARRNEAGVVIIAGASNNTVGGTVAGARNLISANETVGVLIADLETFGNKVLGNRIGTDVGGVAALANLEDGIRIDKSVRNTIGGNVAGSRNLISGNGDEGIEIIGNPFISEDHLNVVIGNYVGTNALGTLALANAGNGISIVDGRADRIGGVLAGDRNLISGNAGHGIHLEGESTSNRIEGNAIGTNAARTAAIGNTIGVHADGTGAGNRIGGTIANSGNTIAGNRADGVSIVGTRVDLFRNRIGLDPKSKPLGNGGSGIVVNSNDNKIGGGANYNVVRFNAVDGVKIDGGSGNRISANRLSDNGGLGINLVNGANNSFGGPLINTASATSTKITLQGTLMASGSQTVTLELFANIAADPSSAGEGAAYIGSVTLTTNAIGAFTAVFTAALPVGYRWLSLTATDVDGNTSEFSICKQV